MANLEAFNRLSPNEQRKVLRAFREAVAARVEEWNALKRMEDLLGEEVDFLVSNYAAGINKPMDLTTEDLREAIS